MDGLKLEVIVKETNQGLIRIFTQSGVEITNSFTWIELEYLKKLDRVKKKSLQDKIQVNGEIYIVEG
jgi:hypothetical protein